MKRLIRIILIGFLICGACCAESGSARVTVADTTDNGRTNIRLAIDAIDGTQLEYGDTFSFNEIVGPRTESKGFLSAANGRGVKVTGGGVARVASAIYLAIQDANIDVEFMDRYTYGSRFAENYVENSSDAILTDYASDIDFSFVCLEDSMTINLEMDDESITCTIDRGTDEIDFLDENNMRTPRVPGAAAGGAAGFEFPDFNDSFDASNVISQSFIDLSEASAQQRSNIEIAADSIDNTILAPGDVFSFNTAVGPREEKYGFVSAVNGRGVKVVGGGVAQVASVMWLAVKNLDEIGIVKRSTYGSNYNQDYVDGANDAILTDYKGNIDFAFRNDGEDELTISVYVSDDMLTCEITN